MHILAAVGAAICKVKKFSWQISVFHICSETAASVRALDRDGNSEHLSESVYAQTRTHTGFHVSLWKQWPALFIVPMCSYTLKTLGKIQKNIQVTISLETYWLGKSERRCINVNLENEHKLIFFYGYKLEIHAVTELGNINDAKLTLHLTESHDPYIISWY